MGKILRKYLGKAWKQTNKIQTQTQFLNMII